MSVDVMVDRPGWVARPVLALGVRAVQYGLPLLAGTVAARLVGGATSDRLAPHWSVALALTAAVAVSLSASRLTLRLGPLALLLQMTMIFPDHAPSRLKVARRSTSAGEIRRQLESQSTDAQDAAVTMLSLVTALSRHDRHTRGHSERVRLFCDLLSRELGLSAADSGRLRWAALIHDIGKLEVSAAVLTKRGSLDADEWTVVRRHPEAGARLAQPLAQWLGPWFAGIIEHHERYDGGGYPMGVSGVQISLAGRAIAVVDAFETMTAARSYKAARSAVAARAELTRCAGTHFDPTVVRAFLGIALPRLLWSVGPMAFVLNVPFLRWIGDGSTRLVDVATATASGAASAAGVTAAVVVAGAVPTAAPLAASSLPPRADTVQSSAHHAGQAAPAVPSNGDRVGPVSSRVEPTHLVQAGLARGTGSPGAPGATVAAASASAAGSTVEPVSSAEPAPASRPVSSSERVPSTRPVEHGSTGQAAKKHEKAAKEREKAAKESGKAAKTKHHDGSDDSGSGSNSHHASSTSKGGSSDQDGSGHRDGSSHEDGSDHGGGKHGKG